MKADEGWFEPSVRVIPQPRREDQCRQARQGVNWIVRVKARV